MEDELGHKTDTGQIDELLSIFSRLLFDLVQSIQHTKRLVP